MMQDQVEYKEICAQRYNFSTLSSHTKITYLIFNIMVFFHSLFYNDANPLSQDYRELWVLKGLPLVFYTVLRQSVTSGSPHNGTVSS